MHANGPGDRISVFTTCGIASVRAGDERYRTQSDDEVDGPQNACHDDTLLAPFGGIQEAGRGQAAEIGEPKNKGPQNPQFA